MNKRWQTSSARRRSNIGKGIQTPREAQEQIGDHRSDDLQANGVVVLAHELAKVEMLLDQRNRSSICQRPL